ncbi:MAG: hypothetical protein JNK52_12180, partial [Zoogloeaceae bacterium]|nr:hypothetical protein [Zoogloeaceae bacterium]
MAEYDSGVSMGSGYPPPVGYTVKTKTVAQGASSTASASHAATQSSTTAVTLNRTVTDYSDGSGDLFGVFGTVLYVAKTVNLKVVADYQERSYQSVFEKSDSFERSAMVDAAEASGGSSATKGGESGTYSRKEDYAANSLTVRYKTGAGVAEAHSMTVVPPPVVLELAPYTSDQVVPGSVQFTWMGTSYVDFEGVIYRGRTDLLPGIASGTIDYRTGLVSMTDYVPGANPAAFTLDSLWTRNGPQEPIASVAFNTTMSPVRPAGLVLSVVDVTGIQLTATADMDGLFNENHVYGKIDYETGLVELQFGDYVTAATLPDAVKAEWWYDEEEIGEDGKIWRPWPVLGDTLRYNVIAYAYLPLPADIIGVDAVRLPQDGRVPIFRPGDVALVMHT